MKTIRATAGVRILRGQFCVARPDGLYRPEPLMEGEGGIARKPYVVMDWPPEPIEEGESFELMVDGGCTAVIGDKPLWVEIRDGRFRLDLAPEAHAAELRAALYRLREKA